jgi:transcriptional regulator with XRE-family HTH domain
MMSADLNSRLASNLQVLRLKLKISQEDAAARCGLHRTYLGAIERDEGNVTLSTLEQIAKGLQVDPLSLLKRGRISK